MYLDVESAKKNDDALASGVDIGTLLLNLTLRVTRALHVSKALIGLLELLEKL